MRDRRYEIMKIRSQLFNGKTTRKRIQAPGKNAEKKIAEQMATIIAGFPGGLLCLLEEFYKEVKRQRKEAKKHHKPIPEAITDLTGVAASWQLIFFIQNELPEDSGQREQIEREKLTEFLVKNSEARQLLANIITFMGDALLAHLEVPTSTDPNMIGSIRKNLEYIKAIKEFFRMDPRKL
jgi:hypothetical protein